MTYNEFYNRLRAVAQMVDDAVFSGLESDGGEYYYDDAVSTEEVRDKLHPILEALDGLALDVVGEEKPQLQWIERGDFVGAPDGVGSYVVYSSSPGIFKAARTSIIANDCWDGGCLPYSSIEEAKTACQKHYEGSL